MSDVNDGYLVPLARSGAKVKEVRTLLEDCLTHGPPAKRVVFGDSCINDLRANPDADTVQNCLEELEAMVKLIKATQPDADMLVLGVPNVSDSYPGAQEINAAVASFNKGLEALARKHAIKLNLPSDDQSFTPDGLHLEADSNYSTQVVEAIQITGIPDIIRQGSKQSVKVREIQELLVEAGYPLPVDGTFDGTTRDAVVAYQQAHSIQTTGEVGPTTFSSLQSKQPKSLPAQPKSPPALRIT